MLVGTKKGGFVLHSQDRRRWSVEGPYMKGLEVYHMILDPRDGRTIYAAAPNPGAVWGPALYRGKLGSALAVTKEAPRFREGSGLALATSHHIAPGRAAAPRRRRAGRAVGG